MSRHTITPYLRGTMWWARIPQVGKPSAQRSLGTTDKFKATEMCAFLGWLRGQRDGYCLAEIGKGTLPIGLAYDAWHQNKLDTFLAEWKQGADDVNLEPYVSKWVQEMERAEQVKSAPKEGVYVHGLYIDGARWDKNNSTLAESEPKRLFSPMPVIMVTVMTKPLQNEARNKLGVVLRSQDYPLWRQITGEA